MRAPTLKIMDTSLRLFLIPLSAVSIWLTVTAHQENTTYGKLDFSNLLGLKYMVCVSAVCGGYSLAAALSSWLGFWATRAWLFFVSDQEPAVTEIVYLAYNGDQEVTWSEACSSYGGFCGRLKLVLGFHFVGVCCFFILAVISAYTLFSRFPPPFVPSTEAEQQDRT